MFDEYFIDKLKSTLNKKNVYVAQLKYICNYFKSISPCDYSWYFNCNGFIMVDVPLEYVDDYIRFVEDIVDCKYTTERNLSGITFCISLSTLYACIS